MARDELAEAKKLAKLWEERWQSVMSETFWRGLEEAEAKLKLEAEVAALRAKIAKLENKPVARPRRKKVTKARPFGPDEERKRQAEAVACLMAKARTMLDLWHLEYDEALVPTMVKSVEELETALTALEQWSAR